MDNRETSQSRNALRHGLTANALILANEDPDMLEVLLNDLTAEFEPQTPVERLLVVEMAHAKWLQYRTWLAESSSINMRMAETAAIVTDTFETFDESVRTAMAIEASLESNGAIDLYNRLDTRSNRQFHRALNALMKRRKNAENERANLSGEEKKNI